MTMLTGFYRILGAILAVGGSIHLGREWSPIQGHLTDRQAWANPRARWAPERRKVDSLGIVGGRSFPRLPLSEYLAP
jgi:hypothetical protein